MTKLHIKSNNFNELKSVIEALELNNSPELKITIELGESESLATSIQNNFRKAMKNRLI